MSSATGSLAGRFHFTLIPTLFTIPALIVLIGLGSWQVERLEWKTALIADRTAALSAPPVPAPMTADGVAALDFHHVSVTGTFDHTHELYIAALDARGITGWQIVTPLILPDQRVLLVNRGFVPETKKNPATREAGQIAGETTIEGILRLALKPTGLIVPENQAKVNFWIYVDLPAMATALGIDPSRLLPYYVEAGPTPNPGGFPIGGQTRISLPNDHLQYAITWYGFAVTLIVVYFVYHYRKPEP
jgi:surfeit locus 1 family protein